MTLERQKEGHHFLNQTFPNRELLNKSSAETKRTVLYRMVFCLVVHDRYVTEDPRYGNKQRTGR